jgi:hypothetical protein
MKTQRSQAQLRISRLLIALLVLNGFICITPSLTPVQAQQNRAIIINADQPNIWTLEQAHYLLAQLHRRNLDLRAKTLEALDPNAINGVRLDVLKSLLEVGVAFDDANRVNNQLLARDKNFNAERRLTLITRRDQLREESLGLTRDIARLQSQSAQTTNEDEKQRLKAEIDEKTSVRAAVDKEIEFTDNELKTITGPSGDFKSTTPGGTFEPSKLPSGALDEIFKEAAKTAVTSFGKEPKLNASLMLENYLQTQYEIIAKQLTLLRDEVGPGERLLFLELPQTVNVVHHEADNKWAQSWWKIVGYGKKIKKKGREDQPDQNKQTLPNSERIKVTIDALRASTKTTLMQQSTTGDQTEDLNVRYVDLDSDSDVAWKTPSGIKADSQLVRTVDLIPRQSSLNVNDLKLQTRAGAFSAMASFLFGFGAKVNLQRQREQFSQFVQQELYSSAFGKGSREFGWTFTPMPGSTRLLSGVRTTYAIVIVPRDAISIVLESNGCYFPRSAYQPNNFDDTKDAKRWAVDNRTSRNCGDSKAFIVPIPGGLGKNDDFNVSGLTYTPVDKGERIVVSIYGDSFSAQTGVLVNGVPLLQSLGLAQPLIRDDSTAGDKAAGELEREKVHGRIERIDADQIVASFEMPADFQGTPIITVVAPGKAIDINRLDDLYINGVSPAALARPRNHPVCSNVVLRNCVTIAAGMFNGDPDAPPLRIDSVEVFRNDDGRTMTAIMTGAGFADGQPVFVNGKMVNGTKVVGKLTAPFISPTLLRAEFNAPLDEKIQVVLSAGDKTIKSKPVANPAFLSVSNVSVVSYEEASEKYPAVLVVKLEGSGFSDWLLPSIGKLVVKSPTEAYLTITKPLPQMTLILTDRRTGAEVKTVILRKPPK